MKIRKKIGNGKEIFAFDLDNLTEMNEGEEYKMVQVYIKGQAKIVFGYESTYHCQILEAYLLELGIPFDSVELPSTDTPGPDKTGKDYMVAGAGKAGIGEGKLWFFGKSIGYMIGPDEEIEAKCTEQITKGLEAIALGYKKSVFEKKEPDIKQKVSTGETNREIPMLEYKLNLLHSCLATTDFTEADKFLNKLVVEAPLFGQEQVSVMEKVAHEYLALKELGKQENALGEKYVSKLAEIRDLLIQP